MVCTNMVQLWSIGCPEENDEIQDSVDRITGDVYNRIRKINLILHSQQTSKSYNFGKSPTDIDDNNLLPVSTVSIKKT